ncbi:tiny macrocysts protein B, partial [Haematococcus lacustris]
MVVLVVPEDDYEGDKVFGNGVMGVMYTVCKEKDKPSVLFMAFRLLADWLQLWMLV